MDEGRVTPSRMLDARSKEPFAMESLDSEVTTSESLTFEAEFKSAQSSQQAAGVSEHDEDFYSTDIIHRASHEDKRSTTSVKKFQDGKDVERSAREVTGNGRDNQNRRSVVDGQQTSQLDHNAEDHGHGYHGSFEGERQGQVKEDFRGNLHFQRGHQEDHTNDQRGSHEYANRADEQTTVGEKPEDMESLVASEMLQTSPSQVSARRTKKPVVSAETKARWELLRTLAGTEKNEVVVEEAETEKVHSSQESEKESAGFEAYAREHHPSAHDRLSPFNKSSFQLERQNSPRKVGHEADNKNFVRSSRAAVESALKRSGPGRHQSSRGDHAESESSMSRAASVKRYMEKLRSDPHIDEMHLAAMPAVTEAEGQMEARFLETDNNIHRMGEEVDALSHKEGNRLENNNSHGIEANVNRGEHKLREEARTVEGGVIRAEYAFDKNIEQQGHQLESAVRSGVKDLGRDARGFEKTLSGVDHRLDRGAHELEHDLAPDARSLSKAFEKVAHNVEHSSDGKDLLRKEARRMEAAIGADGRELRRDANQLEASVGQAEHKLEHSANQIARDLGLGEMGEALGREERKLETDAHKAKEALGREGRELEHDAHTIGAALGLERLDGVLSQESQKLKSEVHKTEAALGVDEHALGASLDQVMHESGKALGETGKSLSRALEHDGHDIKTLGGLGRALLGPDAPHQPGQEGKRLQQTTPFQASRQQQMDSIQHQTPRQPNSRRQEVSRNQQMPAPQQQASFHHQTSPPQHMPAGRKDVPLQQTPMHSQKTFPQAFQPPQTPHQQPPSRLPESRQRGSSQQQIPLHQQGSTQQQASSHPKMAPQQQVPPRQQAPVQQQALLHPQLPSGQQVPFRPNASQNQAMLPHHQAVVPGNPPSHQQSPPFQHSPPRQEGPPTQQTPPKTPQHQGATPPQSAPNVLSSAPKDGHYLQNADIQQPQQPFDQSHMVTQKVQQPPAPTARDHRLKQQEKGLLSANNRLPQQPLHTVSGRGNEAPGQSQHDNHRISEMPPTSLAQMQSMTGENNGGICENESHYATGVCNKGAPCRQQPQMCGNADHYASGICRKGAPCKQQPNSCTNLDHHAAGVCKEGTPCTRSQRSEQLPSCKDTSHHAAGVCSKDAPCTQACQDHNHLGAGICFKGSPCRQLSGIGDLQAQGGSKVVLDSQSCNNSDYCASSAEEEESAQAATTSTISMSPRLDPSEHVPLSPSPHTAVFEQLIYGFKKSSESRIAAVGGSRGFMDRKSTRPRCCPQEYLAGAD